MFRTPVILTLSAFVLSSCGDDSPLATPSDAGSDDVAAVDLGEDAPTASPRPSVPSLVAAISDGPDRVVLIWVPSVDEATPASDLVYEVHAGASLDFVPSTTTLSGEVVGGNSALIDSLSPGQTAFLSVRARDGSGTASHPSPTMVVTVPEAAVVLKDGVTLTDLSHLGPPTVDGDRYLFPGAAGDVPDLASGDYITGLLDDGLFLRRVDNANHTPAQLMVETTPAEPVEVVESGRLVAQIRPPLAPTHLGRASSLGSAAYEDASPGAVSVDGLRTFSVASGPGSNLQGEIGFAPTVTVDVTFGGSLGVEEAVTTVEGDLSLDALLAFTPDFAGALNDRVVFDTRSLTLQYWFGPVPVTHTVAVRGATKLFGAVEQPTAGDFELSLASPFSLDSVFDGRGWRANGESELTTSFDPSLTSAGTLDLEATVEMDVLLAVESLVYTNARVEPHLDLEMLSATSSDCDLNIELQRLDALAALSLATGPSIEAPVEPGLSVPGQSELLFALPVFVIDGPEQAFRPRGGRFTGVGSGGLGAAMVSDTVEWTVTPEVDLAVEAGVATLVPDVASAEPQVYELTATGHTDVLGPGAAMCAKPHTVLASNRQATCEATSVFVLPGEELLFSIECTDPDFDYPLAIAVADGPFVGRLEGDIPRSLECDEIACHTEFAYIVDDPPAAFDDIMVVVPTDAMGLIGSTASGFGLIQLGINRPPEAAPATLIVDLDSEQPVVRELVLDLSDPTVDGDPTPDTIVTELSGVSTLGATIDKIDELTYRYTIPPFTSDAFGDPLPAANLFDDFEILAIDAHGATSQPIVVTAVLRPPLCDGVDVSARDGEEHLSDYCVIEYCAGETCNVECLPRAALDNVLEANRGRYPAATSCADKALRFGTDWSGEQSEPTGQVVDALCPCVGDRPFSDGVWVQFDAPAPYDTCEEWPFEWYTVCTAPPNWQTVEE